MKLIDEWVKNYRILLNCDAETEDIDVIHAAYKAAEAYMQILPKAQRKVLRLRYLEGASWEGIGRLMNMRAEWAKNAAETAICTLEQLIV